MSEHALRYVKRQKLPENLHFIEGEYLSTTEIAQRLALGKSVTLSRLAALRKMDGAITWAKLQNTKVKK